MQYEKHWKTLKTCIAVNPIINLQLGRFQNHPFLAKLGIVYILSGHSRGAQEQPVDQGGSVFLGPLPKEIVQDLSADHANVLIILGNEQNLGVGRCETSPEIE